MVTLMVAALFCGNCLSCPQMLMAPAGQQPAHSCCHHRTAKVDCPSLALGHFVKAQGASVTPVFATAGVAPAVAAVTAPGRPAIAPERAAGMAPLDPLSLQSLLRV
jgi:hypothetical protein